MSEETTGTVIDPTEWHQHLPDVLKDSPYLRPDKEGKVDTPENIAAKLANAAKVQGNIGDTHLKIPAPEAAEADIEAFRKRVMEVDPTLYRKPDDYSPNPEKPEEYTDPQVEGLDAEAVDLEKLKQIAFDSKWNQRQYEMALERIASDQAQAKADGAKWAEDNNAAIAEALGAAKDDHIVRTVAMLKDKHPAIAEAMQNGTMDSGSLLALSDLAHQIIDMGGEGNEFNAQAGSEARGLTPLEAMNKAQEVRGQLKDMSPADKRYEPLLEKLVEYQRLSAA